MPWMLGLLLSAWLSFIAVMLWLRVLTCPADPVPSAVYFSVFRFRPEQAVPWFIMRHWIAHGRVTHSGFILLATLSLCQYYQSSTVFEGFCHVERDLYLRPLYTRILHWINITSIFPNEVVTYLRYNENDDLWKMANGSATSNRRCFRELMRY